MRRYKRQVRWTCCGMVAVAIVCRVLSLGWAGLLPTQETVLSYAFFLETGVLGDFSPQEVLEFAPLVMEHPDEIQENSAETMEASTTEVAVSTVTEAVTTEEAPKTIFTQSQADAIQIGGAGVYEGEILPLLNWDLDLNFSGNAPTVLILHSHTSEAYAQAVGWEYVETDTARTQDATYNIVRVGEVLAEVLTDGGLSVIHDKTIHDYPDYNSSYSNALASIQYWLEKYPSITMVIDVHRDAAEDSNGVPIAYTTSIDGEDVAQMMLVVGTNQGGLSHDDWVENFAFALQLQGTLQADYDDYVRPVNLRTERFNQHATPASMLVEIGGHGNTLEEALKSAEILGQGILDLTAQYDGS